MSLPLPEFRNPPVVEVALSVQFDTLEKLRTPQIGLLWQKLRDRFPRTEDQPPLEPVYERFGVPTSPGGGLRLQLLTKPPPARVWFLNPDGTELIQVQQDRFVHNWRKGDEGGSYPRYESIRGCFEDEVTQFRDFLKQNGMEEFNPNQCEVTYVNHIFPRDSSSGHSHFSEILAPFRPEFSDSFLPQPEDGRLSLRFVIPGRDDPLGRLHVDVQPAYEAASDRPMYRMALTARGRPTGGGIPGVLGFMDLGREWIVRGFASISSTRMHETWERVQ